MDKKDIIKNLLNGEHKLTGVRFSQYSEVGYAVILDDIVLTIGEDYPDEYRSYLGIHINKESVLHNIPEETVKVEGYFEDCLDDWITIKNPIDDSVILNAYTIGDSYYPMAVIDYYPENLNINKMP